MEIKLPLKWEIKESKLMDGSKCYYLYNTSEHKCLVILKAGLYQLNDYPKNEIIELANLLGLKTHKIRNYYTDKKTGRKKYKIDIVVNNIQKDDVTIHLKEVLNALLESL